MRKILWIFVLFLLAGCSGHGGLGTSTHTEIEWVDFIKVKGKMYHVIYNGALADESYVDKQVATVKFKVADNVTDPYYKTKDGDAAFHEKGTEIYAVKGEPDLLAVKSTRAINGYNLYFAGDGSLNKWGYQDMPKDKVVRVEIYQGFVPGEKPVNVLDKKEDIQTFLQLLDASKTDNNYSPVTQNKDPEFYDLVFFTGGPVAYKYNLQYDGITYYWYPGDQKILPPDINLFIR